MSNLHNVYTMNKQIKLKSKGEQKSVQNCIEMVLVLIIHSKIQMMQILKTIGKGGRNNKPKRKELENGGEVMTVK